MKLPRSLLLCLSLCSPSLPACDCAYTTLTHQLIEESNFVASICVTEVTTPCGPPPSYENIYGMGEIIHFELKTLYQGDSLTTLFARDVITSCAFSARVGDEVIVWSYANGNSYPMLESCTPSVRAFVWEGELDWAYRETLRWLEGYRAAAMVGEQGAYPALDLGDVLVDMAPPSPPPLPVKAGRRSLR